MKWRNPGSLKKKANFYVRPFLLHYLVIYIIQRVNAPERLLSAVVPAYRMKPVWRQHLRDLRE